MRRVLVTRARDEAEGAARHLRALGFEPLISPLTEIVATGAPIPPAGDFDAALATSARAFRHAREFGTLASLPFHVVGARTAEAAKARGLRVAATAPDAAGLIARLEQAPRPTRFLYLAARDRRDELERALREAGHAVTTVETYEARAVSSLTSEALDAFARGEIVAALHYSPRSADIFLSVAASSSLPGARETTTHLALSERVARVLREAGCADVRVARAPDEASLLEALRDL
jgi:uroporphyrinogen-III synthase